MSLNYKAIRAAACSTILAFLFLSLAVPEAPAQQQEPSAEQDKSAEQLDLEAAKRKIAELPAEEQESKTGWEPALEMRIRRGRKFLWDFIQRWFGGTP